MQNNYEQRIEDRAIEEFLDDNSEYQAVRECPWCLNPVTVSGQGVRTRLTRPFSFILKLWSQPGYRISPYAHNPTDQER